MNWKFLLAILVSAFAQGVSAEENKVVFDCSIRHSIYATGQPPMTTDLSFQVPVTDYANRGTDNWERGSLPGSSTLVSLGIIDGSSVGVDKYSFNLNLFHVDESGGKKRFFAMSGVVETSSRYLLLSGNGYAVECKR